MFTLAQIARAANVEAMRYENAETALAQVSGIEQVASYDDYRWYVVTGQVFRKASSFENVFVVRTRGDSEIGVLSSYTKDSAKAAAFEDADRIRAKAEAV